MLRSFNEPPNIPQQYQDPRVTLMYIDLLMTSKAAPPLFTRLPITVEHKGMVHLLMLNRKGGSNRRHSHSRDHDGEVYINSSATLL